MEKDQFIIRVLPLKEQLLRYARRFTGCEEEARDTVQEVFVKLWTIRSELHKYDSLGALSMHITRNLCLNALKREKRKRSFADWFSRSGAVPAEESRLEVKDEYAHVLRIVDRLPGLQQSILRMKYIDELEVEEIAQLTGSSPEAIWMNLSRARKKVRELFNKSEKR